MMKWAEPQPETYDTKRKHTALFSMQKLMYTFNEIGEEEEENGYMKSDR